MHNYKTKLFKNFCSGFTDVICYEFEIDILKKNNNIISFILKTHQSIKFFIFFHLILFNLFSVLIYFKNFKNLNLKEKIKIKNLLDTFKIFKVSILIEIFHAVIILKKYNSEKIKKISINKTNKETYSEKFFENIIIGSGPGGSVTALELQKNNKDCLLIEKGEHWEICQKKHPFEEFKEKWQHAGLTATLDGQMIQYSSANCLGGGSEINSGLYHSISDDFIHKHNSKFKYEDFTFNEIERIVNFDLEKQVLQKETLNLKNFFKEGAMKLSLNSETISRFQNEKYEKNSMSKTLLNEYIEKKGKLITGSEVKKIKKLSYKKFQLTIRNKKKNFKIYCKNLFICCGAPYSYNLLKRNNLIKSKIDNFHFHPMTKIIVKYPKTVNNKIGLDVISDQIISHYPKYIFGNAASCLPFLLIPTIKNKQVYNDIKKDYEYMTVYHVTFSFGHGSLIKLPMIDDFFIRYKFDKKNYDLIKEAIDNLIEFSFLSGAEKIFLLDDEISQINRLDFEKKNYRINIKKIKFSAVHLLGGIKINENNVSEFGKVNDQNIFINDSSLINHDLLKNPQGAIMSICLKNIKENLKYL